jgi:hemerythrin
LKLTESRQSVRIAANPSLATTHHLSTALVTAREIDGWKVEGRKMQELEYSWSASMRTGDEGVDSQHKELIRQLNLLLQAMNSGQAAAQVDATLDFLADYAVRHFGYEEQCMERVHCPLAETNKLAHAEFLQKFAAFRQELARDRNAASLVAIRMLKELSTWLIAHIRNVDAKMLPYAEPDGRITGR